MSLRRVALGGAALCALAACGSDAADSPDAGPDLTLALFDPDRLLDIDIRLAPTDWDTLRRQTRSIFDVLGSSCLAQPPASPFTYFPATVTIDGTAIGNVGVRKKGFFGSLSDTRPSLKLNLDEYIDGQEYSGTDNLTLNNNKSDGSRLKQCVGYALFRAAGVPAPRCNFAVVSVNGESLGVYTHVEGVKRSFLRRNFGNDDGNLYEGALSDFRAGWIETFQKKTNESDPDRSDLEAMVPAVEAPDDQLLAALAPHVEIDDFTTFWAMEVLLMHADGYARNTNNFYLYRDSATQQFRFIPWGIDSILFPNTALPWEGGVAPPSAVFAEGALTRRLYRLPETRDAYVARLRELLDTVWDEDAILADMNRIVALISPHVPAAELPLFTSSVDTVQAFVRGRRAVIEGELSPIPPAWDKPLREPWCVDALGTVDWEFTASWNALDGDGIDNFADGSSSMAMTVGGVPPALAGGAIAGIDADTGNPAIRGAAWITMGSDALILQVTVSPQYFTGGVSIPVDWVGASAMAARITFPGGVPTLSIIGLVGEGTLELDAAGTTLGAPITGRIVDATVYESIF